MTDPQGKYGAVTLGSLEKNKTVTPVQSRQTDLPVGMGREIRARPLRRVAQTDRKRGYSVVPRLRMDVYIYIYIYIYITVKNDVQVD